MPDEHIDRFSSRPTPSLAQIVAALSMTYTDTGVLIWLTAGAPHGGGATGYLIREGRMVEVADRVRAIGDADPDDFTVTDGHL